MQWHIVQNVCAAIINKGFQRGIKEHWYEWSSGAKGGRVGCKETG